MIESRCGILCNECDYRGQVNCGSCVNIDKPFWGEACPVKSCCEGKKLEHCGECNDFPCDLLNQFAYDKEQGSHYLARKARHRRKDLCILTLKASKLNT